MFPNLSPWSDPATDVARKLAVHRDLFLVAEVGRRVVGTVIGGYDGHRGWVYRRGGGAGASAEGYGRRLLGEVESRLKDYGCPKVNLQVQGSNREVVGFYAGLGYAVEDRVSMGKRL